MQSIHDIEVKGDGLFFSAQEGDNYCRIVSKFKSRQVEFKNGDTAIKFTCLVIDRADGTVKVADFGKQVMKQLKSYASNKEYAFSDLPDYDINISREGMGQMDTKYTVIPARANTELTLADKEAVADFGSLEDFLNRGNPVKDSMELQGVTKSDEAPPVGDDDFEAIFG